MLVGTIGIRVTRRPGWLVAVGVGAVLAVGSVAFALATPPEAMSMSAGPFLSLLGAALAAGGAFVAWRSLAVRIIATDAGAVPAGDKESATEPAVHPPPIRRGVRWAGWIAAGLLLAIVAVASWPIAIDRLGPEPDPTADYDSAIARFAEITSDEPDFVYEPCRSRLYD
ncbi:MAG: hypothetical protein ACN4IE_17975, partial [Ilumatobacter sp.]